MRRALLAFFTIWFWLGLVSGAAFGQSCWARDTLALRLDTLGATARELTGDERAAALRWFNALPPASSGDWSAVVIADLPGGAGLVLIGHAESFCIRMPVPAAAWPRVKALVLGEGV